MEDRVRIFFNDLQRLDDLVEVVHRKALEGDNAAVHAEVKVLERRSRMLGLDAPRQLDMTLEVHTEIDCGCSASGNREDGRSREDFARITGKNPAVWLFA
jgi:hypothetical protein